MRNLFHLKSKNPHPACPIYKGVCTCEEHLDINKICEPSRQLKSNPIHAFT